jgi:hypothetical protein
MCRGTGAFLAAREDESSCKLTSRLSTRKSRMGARILETRGSVPALGYRNAGFGMLMLILAPRSDVRRALEEKAVSQAAWMDDRVENRLA